MDIRTKEAVRYLGYGRCVVDDQTLQLIQEVFSELEMIAEPKYIYRIFELSFLNENELQIGKLVARSQSLYRNLHGCDSVVLMGITLGTSVDRRMKQLEVLDMSKAVVFQACAATYLEERCDKLQDEIAKQLEKEACYLRPRFSPGYGDFSVLHQREVLDMLEAPKHIGLTLTDGYMLTPTKSVTAIIGVSQTKESCHQRGCKECTKEDCNYRRSEECC